VPEVFITPEDRAVADTRNAAISFAVLGGLLGAGLGAAGGLSRKSGRAGAMAASLGLVLGAALSAGTAMLALPLYFAFQMRLSDEALQNLYLPLFIHITLWAPAGAVGGWAFARGLAPRGATLAIILGGFFGAVVGTLVYEFLAALAFPMGGTHWVISEPIGARLFARVAVATFAAAGAVLGLAVKLSQGGEAPAAAAG
jgi:hypothetical protein